MTDSLNKATGGLSAVWLKPEQQPEWDAFVHRHPFGLVYHLSSWKETIESAFSHIRGRFLALRSADSGAIVAGMPVYSIRSWLLGNRICSVPFASICDPLIHDPGHAALMLSEVEALMASTSSKSIEIRSLKATGLLTDGRLAPSSRFVHHYLKLDRPPEELYAGFSRTGIRQGIARALKHCPDIRRSASPEAVAEFYSILTANRKQLGLPPIPERFFKAMAACFPESQFTLSHVLHGGGVIAVMLTLTDGRTLHVEYTGQTDTGNDLGAGKLLYWDAIERGWESGCSSVSFGRTDISNAGLIQFKKRWGTTEEPITVLGNRGADRSAALGRIARSANWLFRHSPPSVNNVLSAFIYRHHG